ncbi:MAG: glycosyltransferase [Candidatus Eisenbacteria bacterium]
MPLSSEMEKKKLLVIPHFPPLPHVLVRGEALALGLAKDFDVLLLSWSYDPLEERSPPRRYASRLSGLLRRRRVRRKGGIRIVETPLLYARRLDSAPVRWLNTRIVRGVVERFGVEFVLNELSLVNCADLRRPYFIDIVDLPSERDMRQWRRQAEGARGLVTVTHGVREELLKSGLDAEVIGNGADVERLRNADAAAVRRRHGLEGRFVIAYIGNHAEWSGLQFLLDVFKRLRTRIREATLLIVGPGSEIAGAKEKRDRERIEEVRFTGPVDVSEVAGYFAAADMGVLPFEQDPHAGLSFPIKVVEYSAARKVVVATPLRVLQEIGLSNVVLAERRVDTWADAIEKNRNTRWRPEWDGEIAEYDWRRLSARLSAFIRSGLALRT